MREAATEAFEVCMFIRPDPVVMWLGWGYIAFIDSGQR